MFGVLRLAGPVHDAAHHGDAQLLDARVALAPDGHLLAKVGLNVLGHVLKERRGRSAATGTRGHLRREAAQPERLKDLLRDEHLFGAIAVRTRRQRNANRVANSLRREGSTDPAVLATTPLVPIPASVSPRCSG